MKMLKRRLKEQQAVQSNLQIKMQHITTKAAVREIEQERELEDLQE